MIQLNSSLKQEHVRFVFSSSLDDQTWTDLDENKHSDYLKKMENILAKNDYDMSSLNANIRIIRSRGATQDFIYLGIQTSGMSDHGEYRLFNMESESGKPFSVIYVYDEDFNEIETVEI